MKRSLIAIIAALICISCFLQKNRANKSERKMAVTTSTLKKNNSTNFVKGADVGWLPQMEADGFIFYDDSGTKKDCFQILKEHGINTIRLRTWVNPSNDKHTGHCSKNETIDMAKRAQSWGMRTMIDFHYSDSWADPGKQVKPAAWKDHSFTRLLQDVYDYTYDVMNGLKQKGIYPEWVQVGNEITNGMIFPDGHIKNWPQLSQLLNKGYKAVKAVSPQSKVILHIDMGNDKSLYRSWFDSARVHNTQFDIIGLSYYPYWIKYQPDYKQSINDLGNNLTTVAARYGKDVMVVETGGLATNPQDTYNMLIAVQQKVKAVPNNRGLGVIYWEPEGQKSWSDYPLSCWENGRPTKALDAFLE